MKFAPYVVLGIAAAALLTAQTGNRKVTENEQSPTADTSVTLGGKKVTIADAQEITLPNGRPGWEGYCPECAAPLFAIRRRSPAST